MTTEVINLLRDVGKLADHFPKMYHEIESLSERAKALLHKGNYKLVYDEY